MRLDSFSKNSYKMSIKKKWTWHSPNTVPLWSTCMQVFHIMTWLSPHPRTYREHSLSATWGRSGTASWVGLWEPLLVPSNGYDIHKLKHGITTKPLLLLPGKPVITKRVCTKLLDLWLMGGSQTLIRQRWSILADQVYLDALLDFKLFS